MPVQAFDYAIAGEEPLAFLLAAQLRLAHAKSVLVIGSPPSPLRVARSIDLALPFATRPFLWNILGDARDETGRLLAQIDAGEALGKADPVLFARSPTARAALGIIRHIALGQNIRTELFAGYPVTGDINAIRIFDIAELRRNPFWSCFDAWGDKNRLVRLNPDRASLVTNREGSFTIRADEEFEAKRLVLCGENAIRRWASPTRIDRFFVRRPATALLTSPPVQLAAPLIVDLDSGLTARQRDDGGLDCNGIGALPTVTQTLSGYLSVGASTRLAGTAGFELFVAADGAPVFGDLAGGPTVAAGFGAMAAFLAPLLARALVGQPRAEERSALKFWEPDQKSRSGVADFYPASDAMANQ